jgi:CheY-like chemotaxis protein
VDILLIDDDEAVLEVIALMLGAEGHRVISASSAAEGLGRLAADLAVDLVLTDLTMPDTGGWEVARAVRARWPAIRIGLITGTPQQRPPSAGLVDVVIAKPVTLETLRRALDSLGVDEPGGSR